VQLHDISPRLCDRLHADLADLAWPVVTQQWPDAAHSRLQGAVVLRYPAGQHMAPAGAAHQLDQGQLTGSIRLNDDYRGGELALPRQGWDDRAVAVGTVSVWPAVVTHPYRVARVMAGTRYRLALRWRRG
jgi:hypothetical protein